jgi:hypothetical protein
MRANKQDGARVLEKAKIVLVFMGDGWNSPNGLPSQTDADGAFRAIFAGPYMSHLTQYDGIHRAEIVATVNGPSSIGELGKDPRGYLPQVQLISDQQITDALGGVIDALSRPAGEETLYMAIISYGAQPILSDHSESGGGFHFQFDHAGKTHAWGVVTNLSGNTEENIWQSSGALPTVFTHEVVEACTDPDDTSGYRLTPPPKATDPGENELCDYAVSAVVRLPGFARDVNLEGYWSNVHDSWVVPTEYSLRAALGQQTRTFVPNVGSALGGATSLRAAVRTLCN